MASWQVGHLAGVSPTVLSHIVTGRRNPRPTEAARLAQVLGASVGVLFPDLDERP
jgi:transcriptional regulator with XRE-family HTH domain